jgi:hypothetical protein
MLARGGTVATYTLKIYDDITDEKQIKEKTPSDGGFTFSLNDAQEGNSVFGYNKILQDRIDKLEAQLEGDDDDDTGIMGKIGNAVLGWLEEPDKIIQLINSVGSLLKTPQGPQVIGNVVQGAITHFAQQPQQRTQQTVAPAPIERMETNVIDPTVKLQRLGAAIDTLEKADPQLVEHLEKLAEMSRTNPQMFNFLLKNLND